MKMTNAAVKTWDKQLTATGNTYFRGLYVDGSGNTWVGGYDDNGTRPNFVMKLDSSQAISWQRSLRIGTTHSQTEDIAVDSSGNSFAPSYHWVSASSKYNGIFAKYDTSGTLSWQRGLTNTSDTYAIRSEVDGSGNPYVFGYSYNGTRPVGFLIKYNTSGTLQWQRQIYKGVNDSSLRGMDTDSSGNVYAVGLIEGTSYNWGIVAKWNSSGTLQWQRQIYGSQDTRFESCRLDSTDGNLYAVGRIYDTAGSLYRGFIVKYNSSGTLQWQRELYQSGVSTFLHSVTLDSSDDLYVTGYTTFSGDFDIIAARLKNDGSLTGTYTLATKSFTYGTASATEAAGTATEQAGTLTDSAGSATGSTPSYALTNGTKVITKVSI